jgi:hypothetical protein
VSFFSFSLLLFSFCTTAWWVGRMGDAAWLRMAAHISLQHANARVLRQIPQLSASGVPEQMSHGCCLYQQW